MEELVADSLAERRGDEVNETLRGTRAAVEASGAGVSRAGVTGAPSEAPFTTHLSVVDGEGNAVAMTQSLGPSLGSRVVTPGLGFLYASTLGGYLAAGEPGYRPWSSQAPMMALREGELVLVMGGAGARRILSAMVGTVSRWADRELALPTALAAPRLHPSGTTLFVEEGWEAGSTLEIPGIEVIVREPSYFARLNVIEVLADGTKSGVAEPRWIGSAASGPR